MPGDLNLSSAEALALIKGSLTKVTESAAIACYNLVGQNKRTKADQAATQEMRTKFNSLPISATVVIGEGERDKAPMLYIGEKLGKGGIMFDIAVDPLEGTNLCAENKEGAMTVAAIAPKGTLLHAPDIYMEKIAVGFDVQHPEDIDLDNTISRNIQNLAKLKGKSIFDISVTVLERSRHKELIAKIKETGAKVSLISDGDILASLNTLPFNGTSADAYMGIGGAPEGVLSAAALKCLDGYMQGKLITTSEVQKTQIEKGYNIDTNAKLLVTDMVSDDVILSATAVTGNNFLQGLRKKGGKYTTNSLILATLPPFKQLITSEYKAHTA